MLKLNISSRLLLLFLFTASLFSCTRDYLDSAPVRQSDGFRLTMDGPLTRSVETDAILDNMRLYCFAQGGAPLSSGEGGSWSSPFHHQMAGVTRNGMTLHSNQMRTGSWDMVMVSAAGATFTPPVTARKAEELLMYTYAPGAVQADGSRAKAHEIWHRMKRLPEITVDGNHTDACGISRNVAMVRVVVDRAVDVSTVVGATHTVTLHNVPDKISWAGTLLRTVSPGVYATTTSNPDTLVAPLTGKVAFAAATGPGAEIGTFKSDTLTFIIPAHREKDFWTDANNQNMGVTDTITHNMNLSVSFTKASGGTFTKTVEVPRVAPCNRILLLKIKMKDVNVEIKPEVLEWTPQNVNGNMGAPYLNVSNVETIVYDGSVSRVHFWSNQLSDSVFVTKVGRSGGSALADIDTELDRLAGATAVNRYYDQATQTGYIDIANLNLAAGQSDVKIYLKAAGLQREITVKRNVSVQGANLAAPYVGTFHRWNQTGERVVTWSNTGAWTAYVDNPAGSGADVVIDRQPSPAMQNGSLYGTSPTNPEQCKVLEGARSVTGQNRIYFRVGWKANAPDPTQPRYATITVRQGTNNPTGTVIKTLYLRQGEKEDYLMRPTDAVNSGGMNTPTRPAAAKFSPYNLTSATLNTSAPGTATAVQGGVFTDYPSQAGALFQWAGSAGYERSAYHPTNPAGAITGWSTSSPTTYWNTLSANNETCPAGYRRPNDGITNAENTAGAVAGSEMRQSLYLAPQTGTGSNISNMLWGCYADGFFDRRAITNSAVSATDKNVAYVGYLFYNPATNASIFYSAAGYRLFSSGSLSSAGDTGYYWSSSAYGTGTGWHLGFVSGVVLQNVSYRDGGFSVRCVKVPTYTVTFNINGGSGSVPAPIDVTQGSSIVLPSQGSMTAPSAGSSFGGWSTASGAGNTVQYANGASYTPTATITLYAVWAPSTVWRITRGTGSDGRPMLVLTDNPYDLGLYFKWGSLVGLYGGANNDPYDATDVAYDPRTDSPNITSWGNVPFFQDGTLNFPAQTVANKNSGYGDPCKLVNLTKTQIEAGTVDNGIYRLPTDAQHGTLIAGGSSWYTTAGLTPGYQFASLGAANNWYPAAGYRDGSNGTLSSAGSFGYYWSSSAYGTDNGWYLDFGSGSVYHIYDIRNTGFSMRCVLQ